MSYRDESNAIQSRFYTEWKAVQSFSDAQMGVPECVQNTTRVAWPNKTFEKPNDKSWVRLGIASSGADQTTMGDANSATYWYDGTVTVQVFIPTNKGEGEAKTLAEQACVIFRNVEANGIIYDTPYVTPGGTNDGWFQLNVWAPYRRKSA